MKTYLISFIAVSLLVLPFFILAQGYETVPENIGSIEDLLRILDTIGNIIFSVLLVVAFILLVIAAMNFMTASGDTTKIDKARTQLMYCLVGVAIGLLAKGAIAIVRQLVESGGAI